MPNIDKIEAVWKDLDSAYEKALSKKPSLTKFMFVKKALAYNGGVSGLPVINNALLQDLPQDDEHIARFTKLMSVLKQAEDTLNTYGISEDMSLNTQIPYEIVLVEQETEEENFKFSLAELQSDAKEFLTPNALFKAGFVCNTTLMGSDALIDYRSFNCNDYLVLETITELYAWINGVQSRNKAGEPVTAFERAIHSVISRKVAENTFTFPFIAIGDDYVSWVSKYKFQFGTFSSITPEPDEKSSNSAATDSNGVSVVELDVTDAASVDHHIVVVKGA